MKTLKHFINGHYVAGSTEDAFELVSPVDGETYALSPNGGAAEVDQAYWPPQPRSVSGRNRRPRSDKGASGAG